VRPEPLEPLVRLQRRQRLEVEEVVEVVGAGLPQEVQVEQVVVVLSSVLLDLHTMNKVNYRNCSLLYV
jgi:predicted HAD superfamily Cof-like phosphohydrolase